MKTHTVKHWPTTANGYGVCDCGATIRVESGKQVGQWHTCRLCAPEPCTLNEGPHCRPLVVVEPGKPYGVYR